MARPNHPSYFAPRKCWRFMVLGKRQYICKGIPPDERPQRDGIPRRVWDEMDRKIREAEAKTVATSDLTFFWLIQVYLKWVKQEVDANRTAETRYVNQRLHLGLVLELSTQRDVSARLVSPEAIDEFFAKLKLHVSTKTGQPFSAYYIHSIGKTLRGMMRWAARPVSGRVPSRLIPADPLAGYSYPRQPGAVRGYVEGATIRRFLRWAWARARWVDVVRPADPVSGKPVAKLEGKSAANLKRRFDRIYCLMLRFERLTGCRPGEAVGLTWSEISPPIPKQIEGQLRPTWSPVLITVHPDRVKTRKQTTRERKIHITEPVARLLRVIERLPGRHPDFVFTHMRGTRAAVRGHVDPLAGEPWPTGSAASAKLTKWRAEAIACGLEGIESVGPKKLISYANRHGFASEGSSLGFTDEQLAEQLGNTPEVLRRVYAHSVDDLAADTAREMAARRRQAGQKKKREKSAADEESSRT